MSVSVRSFTFSRLTGAAAALWLSGTGAAWAGGGGGEDLGSLNKVALTGLCSALEGFPNFVPLPFCPQVPSITQGVLQLAAWNLVPTEMIRATNNIALGVAVNAGNPSIPPVAPTPPPITAFPVMGTVLSNLLPNLTPLAFISSSKGPAAAAQLYDSNADIFFYAVASLSKSSGKSEQPDTLYLLYDDTSRTNGNLMQGQIVAKMSLPLTVLNNDGTERLVTATLQFKATNAGDCSSSSVIGDFSGSGSPQTLTPPKTQIGVDCAVVFAPSPLSTKSHAVFEVAVPLVITGACSANGTCSPSSLNTDPLYFFNPISNVGFSFFTTDETGFTPPSVSPPQTPILGANGKSIGIGPAAVPLCTSATCPSQNPPAPVFALCANLPGGNGNGQAPVPAVAAYYAISTTGETLLSAALPSSSTSVCPF